MTIIAASVLDANFAELGKEVDRAVKAGVDMFTLDIMDGHFAPRITFGDYVVGQIRSMTDLPIEAHLMVDRPEDWVERFMDVGVDLVVFHVEATSMHKKIIDTVRGRGRKVGVALLSHTPVAEAIKWVEQVDVVNFLAVPVGFGGQSSAPDTFDRISQLRDYATARDQLLTIEVDGGVKPTNAGSYVDAGADMLTVGTGLYHAEDMGRAVSLLRASTAAGRSASSVRLLTELQEARSTEGIDHAAINRAGRLIGARD